MLMFLLLDYQSLNESLGGYLQKEQPDNYSVLKNCIFCGSDDDDDDDGDDGAGDRDGDGDDVIMIVMMMMMVAVLN